MAENLLMEKLKPLIECPVCFERLQPPVKTCVKGHVVCGNCLIKAPNENDEIRGPILDLEVSWRNEIRELNSSTLRRSGSKICPVCRQKFSDIQHTVLNQILDTIPVSCKYKKQGCCESMSISEKTKHESICDYRLVTCRHFSCENSSQKFVCHELGQHVKDHTDIIRITFSAPFFLQMRKLPDDIPMLDKFLYEKDKKECFFCQIDLNWSLKKLKVNVQYIGKRKNAEKYIYEVKINQGLSSARNPNFICNGLCLPYTELVIEKKVPKSVSLNLKDIFFNEDYLSNGFQMGLTVQEIF